MPTPTMLPTTSAVAWTRAPSSLGRRGVRRSRRSAGRGCSHDSSFGRCRGELTVACGGRSGKGVRTRPQETFVPASVRAEDGDRWRGDEWHCQHRLDHQHRAAGLPQDLADDGSQVGPERQRRVATGHDQQRVSRLASTSTSGTCPAHLEGARHVRREVAWDVGIPLELQAGRVEDSRCDRRGGAASMAGAT